MGLLGAYLADKILLGSPGLKLNHPQKTADYLYDDLRIPKPKIKQLNLKKIQAIALTYQDKNINELIKYCIYFVIIKHTI